jgi:HlyD family secretion protein
LKKALIAVAVIVVISILILLNLRKEGSKVEVEVSSAKPRTITKFVTASGRIQATRQVNVSASAIGKITRVAVEEGDHVKAGDFLLQIDPTDYQAAVDQLKASIRSAKAQLEMEEANLRKAQYDHERAKTLHERNVVSENELRTAELKLEVTRARAKTAEEMLAQHRATLNKAVHDLDEVRIVADISGIVTTLNVEEGENAIMGTLNNPGTVLLIIADLSEIETEVEVDETEVVFVRVGQPAFISLDAYPDDTFDGVVMEVGNSAIRTQIGLGQSSVDFKVVISVHDSIPIQCLTIRQRDELSGDDDEQQDTVLTTDDDDSGDSDVEGVFVVEDGIAKYRPVKIGIAGSSYFQITEGLGEGEEVISGPFKAINELKDGDPVKIAESSQN